MGLIAEMTCKLVFLVSLKHLAYPQKEPADDFSDREVMFHKRYWKD